MMRKTRLSRLRKLLNRPLFGTQVFPPGSCVDPAMFPEDEFPVECMQCGYLLRGLPDGRCPECGEQFARGRLLVLKYYYAEDSKSMQFERRWFAASVLALLCLSAGLFFARWLDLLFWFGPFAATIAGVLMVYVVYVSWSYRGAGNWRDARKKRRRIRHALIEQLAKTSDGATGKAVRR